MISPLLKLDVRKAVIEEVRTALEAWNVKHNVPFDIFKVQYITIENDQSIKAFYTDMRYHHGTKKWECVVSQLVLGSISDAYANMYSAYHTSFDAKELKLIW